MGRAFACRRIPTTRMRQRPRDDDDYDDNGSEGDGVEGGGRREGTVDGDGDGNGNDRKAEAARLRRRAEELRAEVRELETRMDDDRAARRGATGPRDRNGYDDGRYDDDEDDERTEGKSLGDMRVLVVGANGRLGSMVVRRLLRYHPELREVVAAVHYVGTSSTRGYGRLSYEVGAEDGIGTIGPAWGGGDDGSNARFVYDPNVMSGYNLNKLRIVEVELLDPVQVRTITEDVDAVVYCASDFEGNRPRAASSLDVAFLFRAISNPTKGRVEIEGLRNCLEGLVGGMNERRWKDERRTSSMTPDGLAGGGGTGRVAVGTGARGRRRRRRLPPTQFVLISSSPDAYGNFETPFGEYNGLKRQGERMVMTEYPSVSHAVLQMGKFDDNFVEEGRELMYAIAEEDTVVVDGVVNAVRRGGGGGGGGGDGTQKRINRRDAARAAVEALLKDDIEGKKVQVYTAVRKTDIW
jgi:nucleoside-diphosphate-sugar epimerase